MLVSSIPFDLLHSCRTAKPDEFRALASEFLRNGEFADSEYYRNVRTVLFSKNKKKLKKSYGISNFSIPG